MLRFLPLALIFLACTRDPAPGVGKVRQVEPTAVTSEVYGTTPAGEARLYTLKNDSLEVRISTYGGIITHLFAPDRNGEMADVVLGFDELDGYLGEYPYFGAFIGRYGNRIAEGKFTLDGQEYTLPVNNGPNSLHGGDVGFNRRLWQREEGSNNEPSITLFGTVPAGDQGYPGELTVLVTYTLKGNDLDILYEAGTDAPTPVNLTNHTYFNLAGGGPITDHELMIAADRYTPVDETLIPTGELAPVAGTPFDFTTPKPIGRDIEADDEQIEFGGGYDHNFVLNRVGKGLQSLIEVYEPTTGRTLEVLTTEPGVQFYTGNFLDGTNVGKGGVAYEFRTGFCLETQHFPDSPNQPSFPSTILRPGEKYESRTVYRFGSR